ncbi:MAG: glutamate racemase [Thermodesulfobacteriota bacterium]|nr:MAG: glutamate racemase [Thermodesulfobacteriota bacterium]
MKENPIGVFDSGIGGLTVLKEIVRALPGEDTVYLGDTARVPYGTKSRETVARYATEDAGFLRGHNVKIVVAACNTASAFGVDELRKNLSVPVTGVITPGAEAAAAVTKSGKVGVIGTEGTIRSKAYSKALKAIDAGIQVFEAACPLFVPLVEEGLLDDPITDLAVSRYLGGLKAEGVDTLVLGCTHYPLLKGAIKKFMGPSTALIDSAEATASEVLRILSEKDLCRKDSQNPSHKFFVTDSPERFAQVGRAFFGDRLDSPETVRLGCA